MREIRNPEPLVVFFVVFSFFFRNFLLLYSNINLWHTLVNSCLLGHLYHNNLPNQSYFVHESQLNIIFLIKLNVTQTITMIVIIVMIPLLRLLLLLLLLLLLPLLLLLLLLLLLIIITLRTIMTIIQITTKC